ncbi:coenzyme Q-binding protein COQ10 homolog, mitochondrial [Genypterus blacodes]|uniref:coenzyme Q-binding protein COQ10 homolog, mitochondrial n=1 Tax=Genypterus blacodes TaxID=154954 RepID=UPI003F75DD51
MSSKTPLLLFLRTVTHMSAARSSNALQQGSLRCAGIRPMRCCGALALRHACLSLCPHAPLRSGTSSSRGFINLIASANSRRIEYTERRTLKFTPEQVYSVVASVDQYQHFVPWCKRSRMMKGKDGVVLAELQIGFAPLVERYVSKVTVIPNHQVRAVCTDGSLFSHLETIWRFAPGAKDQPDSCDVDFHVSFEFKSLLHSQLANSFFDQVVKQMVSAFELRTAMLYRCRQVAPVRRQSV